MKKYRKKILPALLLALVLLFGSCQSESSENPAEEISPVYSDSTVAVAATEPETLPPETEAEESFEYNSTATDDFTFMKQNDTESFFGPGDAENPLYSERDTNLAETYGIKLCEKICTDIISTADNSYLSGDGTDMLSLNLASEAVPLMLRGVLQDLSEAGIGVTSAAAYTYKELCEACAFGTHTYLLPFKGLSSAFSSAYVLCCNTENETTEALYKSYKEGDYTLEQVIEAVCSTAPCLGTTDTEGTAAALLTASGFFIMQHGTSCPYVSTDEWNTKSAIFDSVSSLTSMLGTTEDNGDISILTVSEVPSSACLVLPLPVSAGDRDDRTVSPVNPDSVTVIAAPSGLIYGRKTAAALDAIYNSSEKIIAGYSSVPGLAADTVPLILSRSLTLDGAHIFTWGNLGSLAVSTLLSGGSLSSFTSVSDLSARLKACAASAEIYSERLN